jgi:hypothetical protein
VYVASLVAATAGCSTHQCDNEIVCIDSLGFMKTVNQADACTTSAGGTPITGDAGPYNLQVSTNLSASGYEVVWETTPFVGPWLDFPGMRTYIIQFPSPHMNFTTASGSLAELMNTTATQLSVLNATCAAYSMRMVVRAQVIAPDAGAADAQ